MFSSSETTLNLGGGEHSPKKASILAQGNEKKNVLMLKLLEILNIKFKTFQVN